MVEKKTTVKKTTAAAPKKAAAKPAAKKPTAKKAEIAVDGVNVGFRAGDVYQALSTAGKALSVAEIAKEAKITKEEEQKSNLRAFLDLFNTKHPSPSKNPLKKHQVN